MRYQVSHTTRFRYEQPVATSYQLLHLTPRSFDKQQVLSSKLSVEPIPVSLQQRTDYFGNAVTDIVIQERHEELIITNQAQVDVNADQEILLDLSPPWESIAESMHIPLDNDTRDASKFCFPSPRISLEAVPDFARVSFTQGKPLLRAAMEITKRIFEEFEYQGGVTDVYTPVPHILGARAGVCQDFAHLAIACLRSWGLPARYVSGYLLTQPADGQPRLTGADASHAWFSVWCPEFGWVDFDPTNNLRPQNEHITIGWGRDYSDVSPTRGFIRGGGAQELHVAVDVRPT
ncbi:MAG: transglutaminase family protein [Proteobacteria bacterium]|nr:transglutaminase family protein [Pseudomonadota bacterium]TDJ29354.1 MAG: transglutaminase family protein [Gammaproteobacteria bacterium]